MPIENAEIVRRGFEAYSSRDVEGLIALLTDTVELEPLVTLVDGTTYTGHEGVRRFLADMADDWSELRIEVGELHVDGARVLMLGQFYAIARTSGVTMDFPAAWVCDIEDGQIAHLKAYTDHESARLAVGLPSGESARH